MTWPPSELEWDKILERLPAEARCNPHGHNRPVRALGRRPYGAYVQARP